MKYSKSHKVISTVLSLVVVLSTLSISIEKHFCGDTLVDVAVFSKAKTCCAHAVVDANGITKDSCCKNEVDIVKGLDNIAIKTLDDLNDIEQQVVLSFVYSYVNLYESLPKQIIPHKDYSPPLLTRDIQILDATFLI